MYLNKKFLLVSLVLLFLSATLLTPAFAKGNPKDVMAGKQSKPDGHVVGNRLVLNSTMITAEFEGQKPKIKFYYTGDDENVTRFYVNYKRIIEYDDKNFDGVYQNNESIAQFELESANWNHTSFYNLMNGSKVVGIGINFTVEAPIHIAGKGGSNYTVTIKVATRMYQNRTAEIVSCAGKTVAYNMTAGEIKTDLIIGNWLFASNKNKLAFEVDLVENIPRETRMQHRFEIAEDKGVTKAKSSLNETAMGQGEHKLSPPRNETRINFVGDQSNKTHAFFKFVNTAFLTNKTGTFLVNVSSSYLTSGDSLRVYLSYPNFNGTIEHDPSIGVVSESYPTPQLNIKSLTVDKPVSSEGDPLIVTCTIENVGELNATNVVATLTASGLEISQPTKTVGTITVGSSQTVTFNLKAINIGVYTINATVTASNTDPISKSLSINVSASSSAYTIFAIVAIVLVVGFAIYWKVIKKPKT